MPQFHETVMGKRFYEHQVPQILKQLTRIADAMEEQNRIENLKLGEARKKSENTCQFE